MTFPYPINTSIPNVNNDPVNDVVPMQTNYSNINGYLSVDHVAPGADPGAGFHEQVTFDSKHPQGAQTDPVSVVYTTDGSVINGFTPAAASTTANLLFRNQRAIFPLSALRAFGIFSWPGALGAFSMNNSFNVASATAAITPSRVLITLSTNATVNGANNVAVFICRADGTKATASWSFAANVLTISLGNIIFPAGESFSFSVYQF